MSTLDITNELPFRDSVRSAIASYFSKIDGGSVANVYELVLAEVEKPLLEIVMQYAEGNQSKAARWLGLSRNTLRKLLGKYGIE